MGLQVVERAGLSDVGRQRNANEDSYVIAEPMFVVADGMGGAQAGEVASRAAAEVFEAADHPGGTPEEQLTNLVLEANRRIYEMAQRDESRRGMGTTLTAAMVVDDGVSVGHVGDSRAYRMRDGALEQLTHDHSLVAELQRSGQLSRDAAEHHPQRSIITRALGPESTVDVDAHTHSGRAGDVYLLCSDGLTSMISDDEVGALLRGSGTLDEAAESLVRAANQSGGKDNVTVVLFRIDDDGAGAGDEQDTPSGSDTIHQGLTTDDVQRAVAEQSMREREQESDGAARAPTAVEEHTMIARPGVRPPPAKPVASEHASGRRRVLTAIVGTAVLAIVAAGVWFGARQVYFLGTNDDGLVTLYRGVPYEGPAGMELYSAEATSSVPARTISARRRERILDHEWRSREDGLDLMRQLEAGTLDIGRVAP